MARAYGWLPWFLIGLVPMQPLSAADAQARLAKLDGPELIAKLQTKADRSRAFYELWRRANPGEDRGYDYFRDSHFDIRVIPCPQGQGQKPMFLVLYASDFPFYGERPAEYADAEELFPPRILLPKQRLASDNALTAFTADGREIMPFIDGDNLYPKSAAVRDMTGDGLLERVTDMSYGSGAGRDTQVLYVRTLKEKEVPLLAVLYNWDTPDWTYRVRNTKSLPEIDLGPKTRDGMKAEVTFRWNPASQTFESASGAKGPHFRVLETKDVWNQLHKLKGEALSFPIDPDYVEPERKTQPVPQPPEPEPFPPPAKPYVRQTWAGMTDRELVEHMKNGPMATNFPWNIKEKNRLPEGFWSMPPKQAAQALVRANLSKEIPADWQMAVDDRNGFSAPATGSAALSLPEGNFFLRVGQQDAYLAFSRLVTETNPSPWSSPKLLFSEQIADLRLYPVPPEEARQILQTLWWLDRVRTRSFSPDFSPSLSGYVEDGVRPARLTLRDKEGKTVLETTKALWDLPFSSNTSGYYDREAMMVLAAHLLTTALPDRMQSRWAREKLPPIHLHEQIPSIPDPEKSKSLARRFLAMASRDAGLISEAVASDAALAAGRWNLIETRPDLERILAEAKPVPERTHDEISVERGQVEEQLNAARDQKLVEALQRKVRLLDEEDSEAMLRAQPGLPTPLREAAQIALRLQKERDDSAALLVWASSLEPGSAQAVERLSHIDPERYNRALEWWAYHAEPPYLTQMALFEIGQMEPDKLESIWAALPPERKNNPPALPSPVEKASKMPDEAARVQALISLARSEPIKFDDRSAALDNILVPDDQPWKYRQPEVDALLWELLQRPRAAKGYQIYGPVSVALARRGEVEAFDLMEARLKQADASGEYPSILSSLVTLTQLDSSRFTNRLRDAIAPEFQTTNKSITDLLWAVWAADLRSFQPDLERIATSDSKDYESSLVFGGTATQLSGRYHLARQIANLWSAKDPAIRLRLLVAFALYHPEIVKDHWAPPERARRLREEIKAAAAQLSPTERTRLEVFYRTLEKLAPSERYARSDWFEVLSTVRGIK